jgi:tetratricopeptide (TPR) repeat protein
MSQPPPRPSAPRARALDEAAIEEVSAAGKELPEPLAALVLEVDVAHDAGDPTGVRKRLFELGVGVVRYAVSLALARLARTLGKSAAPEPVAQALRRAYRMTDGRWCELLRTLTSALERLDSRSAKAFRFGAGKEVQALLSARNRFVHEGGDGNDAPECVLAVLGAAQSLLGEPVRVVASIAPVLVEARKGVPRRAGVRRRVPSDAPATVQAGEAYVGDDWMAFSSWLPSVDGCLRLIDAPAAPGKPWRTMVPETGEHRNCAALDEAIHTLAGDDPAAPRAPTDRPALEGRDVAVSLVRRAAAESLEQGIRVLVFTGPQGAGHTRMLREITDAANALGFSRVASAFGSRDRRAPMSALRRALREMEGAPELHGARAAVDRLEEGDVLSNRARIDAAIESIEEALVVASREHPLLLVIDDAHWLDEQSLALLRLLTERATRGAEGHMLIVATAHRDAASSPGLASLLAQIDRDVGTGATRASLDALDVTSAKRVAQGVAPLATEVEQLLLAESGRLPFFLVQPVLVWIETGGLEWRDGAWRPPGPSEPGNADRRRNVLGTAVPGIAELLQARLEGHFAPGSQAENAARAVLAATALHGLPVPLQRLVRVAASVGSGPDIVEAALGSLQEMAVLEMRGLGTYGFVQPMLARAVLEAERVRPWWGRLHRALLEDMEADALLDPVALADGYAALGDEELAMRWRWRAVERRLAQGAFEEASQLAEKIAAQLPDGDDRARAQLAGVEAVLRGGDATEARRRLEAIGLGAGVLPRTRVRWQLAQAGVRLALRRIGEVVDPMLVQDADAQGDARDAVESRLLLATYLRGAKGRELVTEALSRTAAGRGIEDLRYRLLALDLELRYELRTDSPEELRAAAVRARDAARSLGSTWAELDVLNDAAVLEADAGRLDHAIDDLLAVAERARSAGVGSIRRTALVNAAAFAMRAGRHESAKNQASVAAREAREAGDTRQLAIALSMLSEAELNLGDLPGARAAVDESVALLDQWSDPRVVVALLRRAEILEAMGESDGAVHAAERALEQAAAEKSVDLQSRAQLWLAIHRARGGAPGAREALARLVSSLETVSGRLRSATLERLRRARAMLDAEPV